MKRRYSIHHVLRCRVGVALSACVAALSGQVDAQDAPRLPSGPAGVQRFGGYQTRLSFIPEWDAPWRLGPHNDVVVAFPGSGARLVFWHGAQHVPCWVTPDGKWLSHGAVVREGAGPYQDRLCRFAFAAVQESHDARVVVRWRYAPVDAAGELVNEDPVTHWHDWVDEFYTIYPDMTGVRTVTFHSSEWTKPFWIQQDLTLHHPGGGDGDAPQRSTQAVAGGTLASLTSGSAMLYQVVAGVRTAADPSATWGNWPATGAKPAAGHRIHGGSAWMPSRETPTSKTWHMGVGLKTEGSPAPEAAGRSWLNPAKLELKSSGYENHGYSAAEKAHVLGVAPGGSGGPLAIELAASADSPLVNPAIVVKDWGRGPAAVRLNGKDLPQGDALRVGYRRTARGADLVVWLRTSETAPASIEILAK